MLKPGNIVTDREHDSMLRGKQGVVVRVQLRLWGDPEITVRFDRKLYPYHLRDDECPDGIFEVYRPRSLRIDSDWEPEVYADRLFRNRWHSIRVMEAPLNADSLCLVEGCCNRQQQTIWFNIWGSVCNAHVCAEHAKEYQGMCGDSFPWRKKLVA